MNNIRQNPRLPANCPDYIRLAVASAEHKGKTQWRGRYGFYNNGKPSDSMTIVLNTSRACPSRDGEEWWVRPTTMAPKARVVFAEALERVGQDNQRIPRCLARPASTPASAPRYGDPIEDLDELEEMRRLERIIEWEERDNGEPPDRDFY